MIQYPNSPSRVVKLTATYETYGRQLALGDIPSMSRAFVSMTDVKKEVVKLICQEVTSEIAGLCTTSNPSVLRRSSPDDLTKFTWEIVHDEMKIRAPIYLQLLEAAVANSSQRRNVLKTKETVTVPMIDAGCQLVSIFNENMNATRKLKSIILKKGGLKKVAFKRLSPLYICMGYNATNTLFETAGKGFDKHLQNWKSQVEEDVQKENAILLRLGNAVAEGGEECELVQQLYEELQSLRAIMHPGYSFTGDNVDMRILPRQMTLTNRNKDHHMFQLVSFKNRISSNHLPNSSCKADVNQVQFSTFLPSAEDQSTLIEELIVLVGHVWAKYIPSLAWFHECLPKYIVHAQMENTKKKTEKVSEINLLLLIYNGTFI